MNYFDYQPNKPMGRIWSLFVELSELSEEQLLRRDYYQNSYSHTLEIVKAAMSGSIGVTDDADIESFNLGAYEMGCTKRDKIEKFKDAENVLFIVDDLQGEEVERVGYGDVSARKLKSIEESFERLDNIEAFEESLLHLLDIRDEYIISHGVDLVGVLKNALGGISGASKQLAQLVKNDLNLKELVCSLCEGAEEGLLMERLSLVEG